MAGAASRKRTKKGRMTDPPIHSNYPSTGGCSQLAGYWLAIHWLDIHWLDIHWLDIRR
jgi:hypothetical protein